MFEKIKEVIKAIKNMFPAEAKTLIDFVGIAMKNVSPIEIKPTFEVETSQNAAADNTFLSTMIIGRRYFVRLVSKTKDGEEFIYNRFIGFLSEMSKSDEEKRLFEKTSKHAKIILDRISMKWPDISVKIVKT